MRLTAIAKLVADICLISILVGCSTYHPLNSLKGKTIRGKIIGNNNEPYIGQIVAEYGGNLNSTVTDVNGEFTLVFERNHPVIILTDCFGDPCILVKLDKLNIINMDKINKSKSEKLCKAVSRYKEY